VGARGSLILQLRFFYFRFSQHYDLCTRSYPVCYVIMDNPHPPPVERSVMTSQMLNGHDRLCGLCQAMFIRDDEARENPYDIKRIHYSDGIAFIASAKSGRCYFCAWT
jgi:hypothetical protein